MTIKDLLRLGYARTAMVTETYLSDLSDSDLLVRAVPGMNHIAWQVGHIITSHQGMLETLQPGSAPPLPAGFAEKHNRDHATSDDPKGFCTKAEYLALWKGLREATLKVLDSFPDADFEKPAPESMQAYCRNYGDIFLLLSDHETMHCGQYVAVRRKLGKPVTI